MCATRFITDREIYEQVIQQEVPAARAFLWIATADIKDMHVQRGRHYVPFLSVLSEMVERGVSIRLAHAREPGPAFREDYDRYPNLIDGMEMILCPRLHFKCVIVDGRFAYSGSANLTGAGMGSKGPHRRNFEAGFATDDPELVKQIMVPFDQLWMGERCGPCGRKTYCATYAELLEGGR
jgi:phosphatidylserine/phosphatidylglycerophosphate/cardiolipin synthase-like enzyme